MVQHPDGSAVSPKAEDVIVGGAAQEPAADGGALGHLAELLALDEVDGIGPALQVEELAGGHAGGADGAGDLCDDADELRLWNEVGGGVGDDVLESEGEEGVAGENGHVDAVDGVVRRLAPPGGVIVHARKVVVDQ